MEVRFGEFRFDSASRQLLRNDVEVHLTPKAFELLGVLLEAKDRALSKGELTKRLWPDTFVSDANLSVLMAEIRSVLADSPRTPRFIRTVPRFGYAFCGTVTDISRLRPSDPTDTAICWLVAGERRFPLADGENLIGRDPSLPIWFDVTGVSRQHARIAVDRDSATIEDLSSKNGTYVQGERITAAVTLKNGDTIRLGSLQVTFLTRPVTVTTRTETVTGEEPPASSRRP
jgi:DNA-binding winged helix-turn-helix (wHTH) protein